MLFSLRKHHLDLFVADTALNVSRSLCCFTTSKSHGVENNFPRLWGSGISDAIFFFPFLLTLTHLNFFNFNFLTNWDAVFLFLKASSF